MQIFVIQKIKALYLRNAEAHQKLVNRFKSPQRFEAKQINRYNSTALQSKP